jgi:hypothetical protein
VVGNGIMVGIQVGKNPWWRFHCTRKMHIGLTTNVTSHSKLYINSGDHISWYEASESEVPSFFHMSSDARSDCNPERRVAGASL